MRSTHDLTGLRRCCPLLALVAALLLTQGCGKRTHTRLPQAPRAGDTETGIASWYGEPYHGRRAANGEIYDMNGYTAAHRTWPFETMVRVTNLTNRREVDVRITDRGPFVDGRIIDLSRAAAEQIEMTGPGTARVRLQVLSSASSAAFYTVQAGAFADRAKAEALRGKLNSFPHARIVPRGSRPVLYRVLVGKAQTEEGAAQLAGQVRRLSGEAIVVRD
ncbi:MAG: septal ring lytic transglycosylase RlpA family protein [Bryobacterales bacterium]|nr:septal ring lytic transglycosylase RlpA family protein [Bryobacterales bacterium]